MTRKGNVIGDFIRALIHLRHLRSASYNRLRGVYVSEKPNERLIKRKHFWLYYLYSRFLLLALSSTCIRHDYILSGCKSLIYNARECNNAILDAYNVTKSKIQV